MQWIKGSGVAAAEGHVAAAAQIQSLAWELPYAVAVGAAKKRGGGKKGKRKRRRKKRRRRKHNLYLLKLDNQP